MKRHLRGGGLSAFPMDGTQTKRKAKRQTQGKKKIRCKRNEQNPQSIWSWKLKLSNYFKSRKKQALRRKMRWAFLFLGKGKCGGCPFAGTWLPRPGSKGFSHEH
jgi:hypothetical protein